MNPCPKPVRFKDEDYSKKTLARDGICLAGFFLKEPCCGGLDAHHIKTKGSGGGDNPENLITLCRGHHNDAHAGKITKGQMKSWLEELYGCSD